MLVFYHNGSKLSNSSLDKLIDKHKQCAKGRILPTLPLDVIRCIFDISTYGPTYRSLLFTCWNIYNEFILKKNAYFEYEVSKMFNIMQKEYALVVEIDKSQRINGRIGLDLGDFNRKSKTDVKNLKSLSKILTSAFEIPVILQTNLCKFYVDLHIHMKQTQKHSVSLLIIDNDKNYDPEIGPYTDSIINTKIDLSKIKRIITHILYHFPTIEIRGSYYGITDIPLQKYYLEKYITEGIRYCNEQPFYKRLELLNTYD